MCRGMRGHLHLWAVEMYTDHETFWEKFIWIINGSNFVNIVYLLAFLYLL